MSYSDDDSRTQARRLAPKVAEALGAGWSVDATATADNAGAVLVHTDGRGLVLRVGWDGKGRLTVSGRYPHAPDFYRRNDDRPEITVAVTRTPAAIAGEITRRLLPGYETRLAAVRTFLTDAAEDAATRERVTARLCATLPGATNTRGTGLSLPLPGSAYGSGAVLHGGDVTLELHGLPEELAVAVLAAVAAFVADNETPVTSGDKGEIDR